MKFSFFIPVRTYSEQNARPGFATRKRKREQVIAGHAYTRNAYNLNIDGIALAAFNASGKHKFSIHLTRVVPGKGVDNHDNLPYSLKWIVDGIAAGLGFKDDSDERLQWTYSQRKGQPREHGVEVEIEIQ